jgi:hypothetical protein
MAQVFTQKASHKKRLAVTLPFIKQYTLPRE